MASPVSRNRVLLIAALILLLSLGAWLGWRMQQLQSEVVELGEQVSAAQQRAHEAESLARSSADRADVAEEDAIASQAAAADAQELAEQERQQREAADAARLTAELDVLVAENEAQRAEADAVAALAEAARVKAEREREMERMEEALGAIAETRRTALGLVMNLGEESINFDTDEVALEPDDRELLSRIVGVLLTSSGYRVQVFGHTDDVGTPDYNLGLSERRADAVADYLVEAGIDPSIITRRGFGLTKPLVSGTSDKARARNRRVELGIIDSSVEYDVQAQRTQAQR
jgi:outer membrane protein OmpA-like peptidoglycan-associated protein